jgi:glucosamine 6-phosphate synthetase-like amidotransferase/phosphosugar isomerase protein
MCGIFGIANCGSITYDKAEAFRKATRQLLEESQIRGSQASGLCVLAENGAVMYKNGVAARVLVQRPEYSNVVREIKHNTNFRIMIGHTRAPTKGDPKYNENNHPILANSIIGVHNGVIINDDILFAKHSDKISRKGRVDSEIIFRLIDCHLRDGKSIVKSVKETHAAIRGSHACAFMNRNNPRYLTLFCDSYSDLILYNYAQLGAILFASTEPIMERALQRNSVLQTSKATWRRKVKDSCVRIDTNSGKIYTASLKSESGLYDGSIYYA